LTVILAGLKVGSAMTKVRRNTKGPSPQSAEKIVPPTSMKVAKLGGEGVRNKRKGGTA
jgi:hypothetical protein